MKCYLKPQDFSVFFFFVKSCVAPFIAGKGKDTSEQRALEISHWIWKRS